MSKKDVMIVTGVGQISMAIARRMGFGKKIVMGDKNINNAKAIVEIMNNAGFPGTADEVANVAELLMSDKGSFITGSIFLIDGGATSSYYYGPLKPEN